jgi:DtxR family manganese transport transcriptional regulator
LVPGLVKPVRFCSSDGVNRRALRGHGRPLHLRGDSARRRKDHSQELAQDYVEMIAELIEKTGEARLTDLARGLGVTHVTANRTLKRLQRDGFVTTEPYRSIFLTVRGRRVATESRERHEIVVKFLTALGVPTAIAESDAEGIEHHVSRETLAAFLRYLTRRRAASEQRG